MMEQEGNREKGSSRAAETDFVLKWGNRKRHRCVKLKKDQVFSNGNSNKLVDSLTKKKMASRIGVSSAKESPSKNNEDIPTNYRPPCATSPEKEDNRYYATRGSLGLDENRKVLVDHMKEDRRPVWPKLFITLSSKEKEEDFMAMKGCKLPQRPKKRAKLIQRSILLVSPGAWLSDLCQERYEVREKKTSKKKPRGLKAMGSMGSDSE